MGAVAEAENSGAHAGHSLEVSLHNQLKCPMTLPLNHRH